LGVTEREDDKADFRRGDGIGVSEEGGKKRILSPFKKVRECLTFSVGHD